MTGKVRSARPALNWRWCLAVTGNPLLPEFRKLIDFVAAQQSPRNYAWLGLQRLPSASRKRQETVIVRSVHCRRSAASFATGQPVAGEAYHDHTTQNHARHRRLHLDIVDCRERLRTGADLGQRRV